jgi:hypothetical protein
MINFAPQMYKEKMESAYKKYKNEENNHFKDIMSDFPATHNPFNQNLNYEKILRFSDANIGIFFDITKKYAKKRFYFR